MLRRDLLKSLAVGSFFAAHPQFLGSAFAEEGQRRVIPWQNWSGKESCVPRVKSAPRDLDELVSLIRAAQGPVRAAGSGHSFTPLVPTDDTLISLRRFSGLKSLDGEKMRATFGAGTRLGNVGEPLAQAGQALHNMPDINKQTLAGAFATGTHGTGKSLGALHSHLTELQMVTASGDLLTCSRDQNPEIFDAARVSLGSLGVLTEVTLQNRATYKLKRHSWVEPLEDLLSRAGQLGEENLTFEFFFIPFSDMAIATTTNETDEPITGRPPDDDNEGVLELKDLRDKLGWFSALRSWLINQAVKGQGEEEFVDEWWKIFPYEREVRFNEMEYHLPAEVGPDVVRAIRDVIEKKHHEVFFPVEFRYTRADDAWLSPFYNRASCSVAVHRYFEEDFKPFFADVEPIHWAHEGRPHWGKIHTLGAAALSELYPRWQDFLDVRAELDPGGKFLNTHLKDLFGLP
ncbi:MAG: FAD-binding protein [Alphaproteobacteria bacterium]|nr:MAG: FAD-binding protein [Alphaproteobacteria bacterium]